MCFSSFYPGFTCKPKVSDLVDLVDFIFMTYISLFAAPVDISSLCACALENLLSVYLKIRVPSMLSTKSQLSHSQALEGFLLATNLDRRTSMVFSIKSWPMFSRNLEAELYIPKEEINKCGLL